ncbi:MAG: autotransporter-associated beta strand repeat-containing protein [Desulfovibrio sp.]|jgi:autotransporter-associated beta strand protein|nr:autotransporter-associated beta strand repeat-containing protein [Desulfovibrio sp.]
MTIAAAFLQFVMIPTQGIIRRLLVTTFCALLVFCPFREAAAATDVYVTDTSLDQTNFDTIFTPFSVGAPVDLYFSSGTYTFSTSVTTKLDLGLVGSGMNGGTLWDSVLPNGTPLTLSRPSVTLQKGAPDVQFFSTDNVDPFTITRISKLLFDGTGSTGRAISGAVEFSGGITYSAFLDNISDSQGGAILTDDFSAGGIQHSFFSGNASIGGDDLGDGGGAVYSFGVFSGGISDSVFLNNTTSGGGGGGALFISYDFSGGISNSIFSGNIASHGNGAGGAVYIPEGTFSDGISNSIFSGNTAGDFGGAIFVGHDFTGNISYSVFSQNRAIAEGGGAIAIGLPAGSLDGDISNSVFSGNTAGDGGAMAVAGALANTARAGGYADLSGSKFLDNHASGSGGALSLGNGSMLAALTPAEDVVFQGNTAGGAANALAYGGSLGLGLGAAVGNTLWFYDPVQGSGDITINATAATLGGTVVFDQHKSAVTGSTTVENGTMVLQNGAIFGANGNGGTFILDATATLKVAYDRERTLYIPVYGDETGQVNADPAKNIYLLGLRGADGSPVPTDSDPDDLPTETPTYGTTYNTLSSINASGGATLNGTLNITAPADLQALGTDPLLRVTGVVTLGADSVANVSAPTFAWNGIGTQSTLVVLQSDAVSGFGSGTNAFSAFTLNGHNISDLTETSHPEHYIRVPNTLQNGLIYTENKVMLNYGLVWYADVLPHGTFDVASAYPFTVGVPLNDRPEVPGTIAPYSGYGWDGKSLTKTGDGTLTLAAANTYTGDTTIEDGTLEITGSLGADKGNSYAGNIINKSRLVFNQAINQTLAAPGAVSGTGDLVKKGTGTLTLAGENTYKGKTTIEDGSLIVTGSLDTQGTPNAYDYAQQITNDGNLIFNQPGKIQTLSAQSMSGAGYLTVQAGTLALDDYDISSQTRLTLQDGGTLDISGFSAYKNPQELYVVNSGTIQNDAVPLNLAGKHIVFVLPANASAATPPILTVDGSAQTDIRTAQVGVSAPGGLVLNKGEHIVLIRTQAQGNLLSDHYGQPIQVQGKNGLLRQNFSLLLDDAASARELWLTALDSAGLDPGAKGPSEGFAAGGAVLNTGSDLIAFQGMDEAVAAAGDKDNLTGWGIFGVVSGNSSRYHSGSHVDVTSYAAMTGISFGANTPAGRITLGAFFEFGGGIYKTHNSIDNAPSVDGDGNMSYVGGGILAHMSFVKNKTGHFYLDASARAGSITSNWSSSDLTDENRRGTSYDATTPYYGLHAGGGYIFQVTQRASLDVHAKYFWTRREGTSVTLHGKNSFVFDPLTSSRLRAGLRLNYDANGRVFPYVGLAYEREFDSAQRARTQGYDVPVPSLKGDTGVGEIGLILRPAPNVPLRLEIGLQGYVGVREGVSGTARFVYEF